MQYRASRVWMVVTVLAAAALLPAAAQVKDHTKIKYPPLPEFKVEHPEIYDLPNGMKVFLLEDHELPLISVRARIRTGDNFEPADKAGLADIMATVQRTGGTESMTGDEIDDYLADRAASIETGMGGTSGFASMDTLTDSFDDVFAVFADVLRHPVFDEEMIDVATGQIKTGIARRNDNIGSIVGREFNRLIYGEDSPIVQMVEYSTVAAITRDDLIEWHATYYHPNNIYLGVVGDFDSATMKKKIAAAFGDWPKGPAFDPPEIPHRDDFNAGVFFVEKDEVVQANIAIGHLGITRDNPDYYAVQVMNEVLGAAFTGRLFSNVRTKKGLAYQVYGSVGAGYEYPGVFRVGLQTKSETMGEAVDALEEEIVGIIERPATDEELVAAKEAILNSFVFNYDSKGEILSQQMNYAYHGLPADYLEQYRSNIEKVTKEDVARVAKKYVHPDQLTILVVGKSEDFDRPMDSFGEFVALDITIPPPVVTTAAIVRSEANLALGAEIFSRMVRAMGGENPEGVNAIQTEGAVSISIQGQSMSLNQNVLTVFPDKVRQVIQSPMGEQAIVINGENGFMMMGGQSQDLPASRVQEANRDFGRELGFLARYHADPEIEAVAAGTEEIDGTPCDIIAVSYRGAESRLWVAPDGRVLKQTYQGDHPFQGTPGQIELYFSEYSEVDGIMVPHSRVMRFDGEEIMTLTVDAYKINPEVDMAIFEKPEA